MPYMAVSEALAATGIFTTIPEAGPKTSGWRTFAQIRATVARRMGARTDLDDTDLKDTVNEAYVDLCSFIEFDFLNGSQTWNTVSGQPLYLMPLSYKAIPATVFQDTTAWNNGEPLQATSFEEIRRLPNLDNGTPQIFGLHGQILVLYPIPDRTITMVSEISSRPVLLSADADYSVLPDEWIEPWIRLSISKTHLFLQEFELAGQNYNEYLSLARSRTDTDALRQKGQLGRAYFPRSEKEITNSKRRLSSWPFSL